MEATRALVIRTGGPEETQAVGAALARALPAGFTLSLEGPLGAGKTVLVRGLCEGLGVTTPVTSPTYTLQNEYVAADGSRFLHVDAFRLQGARELEDLGVEDRRDGDTRLVVEWGDRVRPALPADTVRIALEPEPDGEDDERRVCIEVPPGVVLQGLEPTPPPADPDEEVA
jgi:tRNA threonylcarbamoyladenosine biosynthesis protein TsaE